MRQRGFTLIELVLAIAILSVILTIAYSSLSQIMQSKALLDDERDGKAVANGILSRLTKEFQLVTSLRGSGLLGPCDGDSAQGNAATLPYSLEGKEQSLPSGARGDSVTFLAAEGGQYLPDGGSHSGLVQINYSLEANREDPSAILYTLIREERPHIRPPDRSCKKLFRFAISQRVSDFKVQYYDPDNKRWVTSWGGSGFTGRSDALPSIIRFSVTIRSLRGKDHTFATSVPIREAVPPQ